MEEINLDISRTVNPEYFDLLDEFNSISAEYKRVNKLLLNYRVPKVFLLGQKDKLALLGKQVNQLHERFLKWDNKAFKFLVKPNLIFPKIIKTNTNFLHYTNVLRDTRFEGIGAFETLMRNYNLCYNSYRSQLNFVIAMIGLFLALIGIFISFIGTILSFVGMIISFIGVIISILTLG